MPPFIASRRIARWAPALRCGVFALLVPLALPLAAQTLPEGLTLTTVDPPRGASAEAYRAAIRGRVQSGASYATDVQGGRLTVDSRAPQRAIRLPARGPVIDGNIALLVVVGGLALALFVWLRFGGGALLARTPVPDRVPSQPPDGWSMEPADTALGHDDLLAQIAAMPDRRAAMVRLLRHCLLHAADASGTRLARSDTERRVLARLPEHYRTASVLPDLLRATELAHYGGRAVSDAELANSLSAARGLLRAGVAHA